MCSYVVEELLDTLASLFGWFGLFTCDFVECKENGDVNCSRVVKEASNYLYLMGAGVYGQCWARFGLSCLYLTSCFGMYSGMELSTHPSS